MDKTFKFFRKAKETDFVALRDHVPCHIFQCFDWNTGMEDPLVGRQALLWLVAEPETTPAERYQHFEDFVDKDEDEKTDFLTGMLTQALPNQATARIKLRIALHPRTTDSSLGVIVPPLAPQDVHGANKDIRPVPIGQLRGITGCIGPIRECTLILPPHVAQRQQFDDDEMQWEDLHVATSHVVLRTGPFVQSTALAIYPPGTVCRQVGIPQAFDGMKRARVAMVSQFCSQVYGFVTIDARMSGGPSFFRDADPLSDRVLVRPTTWPHPLQQDPTL
eukprot:6491410-Amphidinium_carterae.1